jgi:hypothetical protein
LTNVVAFVNIQISSCDKVFPQQPLATQRNDYEMVSLCD